MRRVPEAPVLVSRKVHQNSSARHRHCLQCLYSVQKIPVKKKQITKALVFSMCLLQPSSLLALGDVMLQSVNTRSNDFIFLPYNDYLHTRDVLNFDRLQNLDLCFKYQTEGLVTVATDDLAKETGKY